MGHQVTMQSEMPIMNWVLFDPLCHKVGHAQQHSLIKWKWYISNCAWAGPEGISNLHEEVTQITMVPTPLLCLLSPSLTYGFFGSFL